MSSWAPRVAPYLVVIDAFVDDRLSAASFETVFLRLYLLDPTPWPAGLFHILDSLFYYVDDYCDDPETRSAVGGIDAEQLRRYAAHALDQLRAVRA